MLSELPAGKRDIIAQYALRCDISPRGIIMRLGTAAWISAVFAIVVFCEAGVAAETYPNKPIRLIVPFPPGGGNDIVGRVCAQRLADQLGQQVIVDNRGGGAGILGAETAARASADGYTLLFGGVASLSINPSLRKNLAYDPLKDFAAVSLVATGANVLATHPSLAVRNVKELIALAKAKPGQLYFASAGVGSSNHLAGELFNTMAGTQLVHVPYKGSGPAMTELLAGQVGISFAAISAVLPFVKESRLRGLAVTTAKRTAIMPELPTVSESGLAGFEVVNWYAVVAPAATSPAIIQRLNAELLKVVATPEVKKRFLEIGVDAAGSTPADLTAYNRSELAKWAKVIKSAGVKPE